MVLRNIRSFWLWLPLLVLAIAHVPVHAQVLFEDDLSSSVWRGDLPIYDHHNPDRGDGSFAPFLTRFAGAPAATFGTLEGVRVCRLQQSLAPLTHTGLVTKTIFKAASFRYELRFNTVTQGPFSTDPSTAHSIDGFLEIGLFDPEDPSRYDVASLFGNRYHLERTFQAMSGIDGFGNGWHNPSNPDGSIDTGIRDGGVLCDYRDNTWYRLVLTGAPGQKITAQLETDGGEIITSWTFAHDTSAFSRGFHISVSQYMGYPTGVFPVDVAVNYARLTGSTTVAPRPSLSRLEPSGATAGSPDITMTVTGNGFQAGSVARWQGQSLPTTAISATTLRVQIPASLLTQVTNANITVVNPGSPPIRSLNALRFAVEPAGAVPRLELVGPIRTGNYFGDGRLEIDVANRGTQEVAGIRFDSQDQILRLSQAPSGMGAYRVTATTLDGQPFGGTLAPGKSVHLSILWRLLSTDPRSGNATIQFRTAQRAFLVGQVGVIFP
jgi:hypothetical protein